MVSSIYLIGKVSCAKSSCKLVSVWFCIEVEGEKTKMPSLRLLAIAFLLLFMLFTLSGCINRFEGVYVSEYDSYVIPVTMSFSDGIVQMKSMGIFTINGVYSIQNSYVTIKLNLYGQEEVLTGRIHENSIVFSDMTLKKR